MAVLLTVGDLEPFGLSLTSGQLSVMIDDVTALAGQAAPCLSGDLPEGLAAAARAVLRGAVLRWAGEQSQENRQMMAGPYSIGPVPGSERKPLLWPSEITQLQAVCSAVSGAKPGGFGQIKLAAPAWWVR